MSARDAACGSEVLIVIQARMGSTRLPGKILLDLEGQPLLIRLVERVTRIRARKKIVVATSIDSIDDSVFELCKRAGIELFRGHPTDLLDRHYKVALYYGAKFVAKIPSDCPLIDPEIIDKVFAAFFRSKCDYCSNLHPATYPDGNDVEIFTMAALKQAWELAHLDFEREHTTPFLWEKPDVYCIQNVEWEKHAGEGKKYPMTHRWTIDYPEDYEFIQTVYKHLYAKKPDFDSEDILGLINKIPGIHSINAKYAGVNWYRHHLSELTTVHAEDTRNIE